MNIYEQALGENFHKLHPQLQYRYGFQKKKVFEAEGIMRKIEHGPNWLKPIYHLGTKRNLLFPEQGKDIPFKIRNSCRNGKNGETQVYWERTFYFDDTQRYFNALMSYDAKRKIVKDYLGEPPIMYSDLYFTVEDNGKTLKIASRRQRLILGRIEIPLPRFLHGIAKVSESYDEEADLFRIKVTVRNPLIGKIFSYEGEFLQGEGGAR